MILKNTIRLQKGQDNDGGRFCEQITSKIEFDLMLEKLPHQEKQILEMRRDGYTLPEIAIILEIDNIYYTINKIHHKLKSPHNRGS